MTFLNLDDVSDVEIEELAISAGRLDLSHTVRREFLKEMTSRDVQAAPGAGKTTLLGLKLRLIARRWTPDMGAIAIVTHTNVAKQEIQNQLSGHPDAEVLLRYPHFIGTLTHFAHQFLALPTVRGLGFEIQLIDSEMFASAAAAALRANRGAHGWIANQSGLPQTRPFMDRVQAGALKIAKDLTLDVDNLRQLALPPGLTDRATATCISLQAVKNSLNARGLFSYEDMMAIANHALTYIPDLPSVLATRFPLIILDEAQDTSPEAFRMLHAIRDAGGILQCIGDVNQAILSDGASPAWQFSANALDLNETKRFGTSLATVASKFGVHRPQTIVSTTEPDTLLHAIIFPEGSEHLVAAEYAKIVHTNIGPRGEFWAVGQRRNANDTATRPQLVLGSYFPDLGVQGTLLGEPSLHQSIIQFGDGSCSLSVVEDVLRKTISHCCTPEEGLTKLLRQGNLLRAFERQHPEIGQSLRLWLARQLENPPKTEAQWDTVKNELFATLAPLAPIAGMVTTCEHIKFGGNTVLTGGKTATDENHQIFDVDGAKVKINVGTIASIKGQTHDATLLLQTSFANIHPFKKFTEAMSATTAKVWGSTEASLLANFYVALTRPRRLLAIAARTDQITTVSRSALMRGGWQITDIPAPAISTS